MSDDVAFQETTDIIIIGAGAAGLAAAISAKNADADIIILDRASGAGGTTNLAAGHIYMGGGTPVQTANGFDDTADDMFAYLMENTPYPDAEKIRAYSDDSLKHFNWLESQGVPFNRDFYPAKDVMQWGPECLIWSGNEQVWPFREKARPAPRGHKVAREGEGGIALIKALSTKLQSLDVDILFDHKVTNLIADPDGNIIGAQISHFGIIRNIRASQAVIICAGGYALNEDMLNHYAPKLSDERIERQGTSGDDGAGINLGISAGGEVQYMDECFVTSPFYPPGDLVKGILVNRAGKRFVAEDSYHSKSAAACLQQTDSKAYLIVDSEIFERPAYGWQPLIDGWDTIADMEAGLGMPQDSLEATLGDYNAHAQKKQDPKFHKHPEYVSPLVTPPFAAFDLSLGKATYVGFTLGGLKTNIDGQVINTDGDTVQGLYAAGACASNIAQDARGYSSGTCLGEATYFGRRAGRKAAVKDVRQ